MINESNVNNVVLCLFFVFFFVCQIDIYSYGMFLVELLDGRRPFEEPGLFLLNIRDQVILVLWVLWGGGGACCELYRSHR